MLGNARFRSRSTSALFPQDPACKLCGAPCEDALHFVSCCPSLATSLLSSAPPPVASLLPDPSLNPRDFLDVVLGVRWIASVCSSVSVSCSYKNCVTLVPLCYLLSDFVLTDNSPFAEARK